MQLDSGLTCDGSLDVPDRESVGVREREAPVHQQDVVDPAGVCSRTTPLPGPIFRRKGARLAGERVRGAANLAPVPQRSEESPITNQIGRLSAANTTQIMTLPPDSRIPDDTIEAGRQPTCLMPWG